ncbi:MAG: HlyD family secretion protein, partial [Gemmataceae bacterium]
MTVPADSGVLGEPAVNGAASLSDRVKGLRLQTGQSGRSSGGSGWLPWTLCLLMAVTWASFAVRAYTTGGWKAFIGATGDQHAVATAPAESTKKDKSSVAPATAEELVLTVKGNMIAARQIQVGPDRVSGKITKLTFVEGQHFKVGDALAEIDKIDYESEYLQSKAAREALAAQLLEMTNGSRPAERMQAQGQLEEAQAVLEQYRHDLARYEGVKRGGMQVGEKEYDQARYSAKMQEARVKQMENNYSLVMEGPRKERIAGMQAQLDQAVAREKLAKEMLDRCVIRAPVTGIVLSKRTEIGNLVNPLAMNANFNGGICEMADLTDLEVDLEVEERDIRKVFVGQDCVVRADAFPERRYSAKVDRIMPVANSSKHIVPIRVKVRVQRSEEGQYLK